MGHYICGMDGRKHVGGSKKPLLDLMNGTLSLGLPMHLVKMDFAKKESMTPLLCGVTRKTKRRRGSRWLSRMPMHQHAVLDRSWLLLALWDSICGGGGGGACIWSFFVLSWLELVLTRRCVFVIIVVVAFDIVVFSRFGPACRSAIPRFSLAERQGSSPVKSLLGDNALLHVFF